MSIVQFLRILWARRLIVIAATLGCFLAALFVAVMVPPRYEATSRLMLDVVKPDPVTGQVIANQFARAYVKTQTELIRDYRVAGQVVDELGWISEPVLIRQFQERAGGEERDFRRWLAQRIIANTQARLLEGSNILEISYTAPTPDAAKLIADALRKAYIDTSLGFRRESANRTAEFYDAQATKAKAALAAAEAEKSGYERAHGIVLQDNNTDVDSARLQALASAGAPAPAMVTGGGGGSSPAAMQVAQLNAAIAQALQTLGPNHPDVQELRRRRAAIASVAASERGGSVTIGGGGNIDRAVEVQKARVIAQRDKVEHLRQLQDVVNLRREQFTKTATRAAETRTEAESGETGLTVLASAVAPEKPVFPNVPLILFGALGFGLSLGILVALLAELLGRRVRGVEDLEDLGDVPLLGVIARSGGTRSLWERLGLRTGGRAMAGA